MVYSYLRQASMALYKIADFNPHYREAFAGQDIKGLEVCTARGEKIGTVADALVDDEGRLQYLIVDTGFWIFGKQVLLPIGRASLDRALQRVYVYDLSKSQVEALPAYDEGTLIDMNYEEQVNRVYDMLPLETPVSVETPTPVEAAPAQPWVVVAKSLERGSPHPTGVQAETTVPPQPQPIRQEYREPAIDAIDRSTPIMAAPRTTDSSTLALSDEDTLIFLNHADLQSGEVSRIEVYAESAEIRREAFVRESVRCRKQVVSDRADVQEVLQREVLDITTEGHPLIRS